MRMLCWSPHCSSSHVLTQMAAVWSKLYSVMAKMCNNVHCCSREKNMIFNWEFAYKKKYFFNFQLTLRNVDLLTIRIRILEQ